MTFRSGLPEYARSFKFLADIVTHRMRILYPDLPEGWRLWVFPGHLWMQYIYDDIQAAQALGLTDIADVFLDNIHVDPVVGGYGICCLIVRLYYDFDLTEAEGVFIPEGMSQATAEYFWTLANRIAADYAPAGRGGSQGDALVFDPALHDDLLADWTFDGTDAVLAAPANAALPVVSGVATVGEDLSAAPGGWTAWPHLSATTYQWKSSTDAGSSWSNMIGHAGAMLTVPGRSRDACCASPSRPPKAPAAPPHIPLPSARSRLARRPQADCRNFWRPRRQMDTPDPCQALRRLGRRSLGGAAGAVEYQRDRHQRAIMAGAAGAFVCWLISERRRVRDGIVSVVVGR